MNQYDRAMNAPAFRRSASLIPFAILSLLLSAGIGCFRATGIQRSSLAGVEIPVVGGDRPAGMKAEAAAGDYYLGHDFVELAVDGTPFRTDRQAGAASGGSIIDLSYRPGYQQARFDPWRLLIALHLWPTRSELPFVFVISHRWRHCDSSIQMTGYLLDTKHKLGATWDPMGCVQGVTASQGHAGRRIAYLLETTVRNGGGGTLVQTQGLSIPTRGGLRIVIPADADAAGSLYRMHGRSDSGRDFAHPLTTSVRAEWLDSSGGARGGDPGFPYQLRGPATGRGSPVGGFGSSGCSCRNPSHLPTARGGGQSSHRKPWRGPVPDLSAQTLLRWRPEYGRCSTRPDDGDLQHHDR